MVTNYSEGGGGDYTMAGWVIFAQQLEVLAILKGGRKKFPLF